MNLSLISILIVFLGYAQPTPDPRKTRERFYITNLMILLTFYTGYLFIQIKKEEYLGVSLATLLLLQTLKDIKRYLRDE
jgi:drug/metabolite transporter (DMT)-like permease